jgi:hypothetical protein
MDWRIARFDGENWTNVMLTTMAMTLQSRLTGRLLRSPWRQFSPDINARDLTIGTAHRLRNGFQSTNEPMPGLARIDDIVHLQKRCTAQSLILLVGLFDHLIELDLAQCGIFDRSELFAVCELNRAFEPVRSKN